MELDTISYVLGDNATSKYTPDALLRIILQQSKITVEGHPLPVMTLNEHAPPAGAQVVPRCQGTAKGLSFLPINDPRARLLGPTLEAENSAGSARHTASNSHELAYPRSLRSQSHSAQVRTDFAHGCCCLSRRPRARCSSPTWPEHPI